MLGLSSKLTSLQTILKKLFLEKFKLTISTTERLTNNFFSDASGWSIPPFNSSTTSITGGQMVLNNAPNTGAFYFDNATEAGKSYQVKFTISEYSSGGIRIRFPEDADRVYNADGNYTAIITANTPTNATRLTFTIVGTTTLKVDNVFVKEITSPPLAAFSLRKLGKVSPYACRIRRSSDNTEAQVEFAGSAVSEFSRVRNTSQNIIAYSEDFSHSEWVKSNASVLKSLITDPFGGTNAWRFKEANSSSNSKLLVESVAVSDATSYTYSVHAKKGELDVLQMFLGNINYRGGANHANFDLTNGTVTATGGGISANIEAVGTDGWYRCSITATTDQAGNTEASLVLQSSTTASRNLAYSGNGSNGIYLFGAMLEETPNYSNEGTEIVNDDFSANTTGWTTSVGVGIDSSASIIDGVLKVNVVNNGYVRATKSITYDQNKYYILTATVNGTAGKAIRFRDDSGDLGGLTDGFDPPTGAGGKVDGRVTMTGSSQQVSFTWIPTAQSDEIIIERHSSGTYEFTVDDLLIKEYDPLYQDDFTTDTSWNTSQSGSSTVTIPSNGKALLTVANTNPNYASMSKSLTYDEGSRYRVTATIKGTSGKTVRFRDTFNTGGGLQANATGTQTEGRVTLNGSDQSISLDFTATSASDKIIFERDAFAVGTCTIDNLIIQKLIPSTSEYISTPVVSNDGLQFVESDLDSFVGGENHLPRSQDFDNWNEVGGSQTIVENHVNHLGESTASLITTTTTGARIEKVISIVAGQTYVASVWVKRYNSSRFEMYVLQGGPSYAPQGYIRANISSSDGSLSTHENHSNTSEITYTDFGEGWYRASFKFTATSDDNSAVFRLRAGANNDGNADLDANKGAYFFGAQLNKDSLKDYQKTEATARDGRASIVTLYNAVGGEDAHQATQTDQPLLYHRGLLVRDGTSPAMLFTQTQRKHLDLQNLSALTTGHIFAVLSVTNDPPDGTAAQGSNRLWELGTGGNSHHPFAHASTSTVAHSFGSDTRKSGLDLSSLNLENKHLLTIKSKTNDWNMRIDGVSKQTASTNTVAFPSAPFIGSDSSVFGGKYSEIILFDSDQDSNIDAIQSDIADFHNITLL